MADNVNVGEMVLEFSAKTDALAAGIKDIQDKMNGYAKTAKNVDKYTTVRLELKVIADVGLVGKPNAGKSTLLSRLSRARPEIANYPFTTRYPNLGRVQLGMDFSFVMADIPGLIEGAHQGVGLGHEFLRHIERAGILVHLVEPTPMDGTSPLDNYRTIRNELAQHDAALAARPEILVISKGELPDAQTVRAELAEAAGQEPLVISAVTGQNLNLLIQRIARALQGQESEG